MSSLNASYSSRYQILESLEKGDWFESYVSYDQKQKNLVLFKLFSPAFSQDENNVQNLKRTLFLISTFSHDGFFKLLDFGMDGPRFYIATEFEQGAPLHVWLREHEPVSVSDAVRLVIQVSEALVYLERRHLFHRHLVPESIWFTHSGKAVIMNLENLGFQDEKEKSTDIQRIGSLLEEILLGKGVQKFKLFLPQELERIILKCKSSQKGLTYETAEQLLSDLRAFQQNMNGGLKIPLTSSGSKNTVRSKNARPSRLSGYLFLLLTTAAVFFLLPSLVQMLLFPGKDVVVPNVTGKQLEQAQILLQQDNLKVNVMGKEYRPGVHENMVLRQAPLPGKLVKEGKIIQLVISTTGEKILVPDVRNLKLEEARRLLKLKNLPLGNVRNVPSNTLAQGLVSNQHPLPQAEVLEGTMVDLDISAGPEKKLVEMPDVTGVEMSLARETLKGLNLVLKSIQYVEHESIPEGSVVRQNPPPKQQVEEGSSVQLTVSKGQKLPEPKPTETAPEPEVKVAEVSIVVPEGKETRVVKIVVKDDNGMRTEYENVHKPNDKVVQKVTGVGYVTIEVYIDDELKKTESL